MKFSCEKYLLQNACMTAMRAVASKSPIQALEGLLLEAGDELKITGYDLKKGIYTWIDADVAERVADRRIVLVYQNHDALAAVRGGKRLDGVSEIECHRLAFVVCVAGIFQPLLDMLGE